MSQFVLFALSLLAIHWIWHREAIAAPLRTRLLAWANGNPRRAFWMSPLLCEKCSPIWFGAGWALLYPSAPWWMILTLAAYPVVRACTALASGHHPFMSPLDRAKANMRPVAGQACATCPGN